MTDKLQSQELSALLDYLKRNRGFDFTGYKLPSLTRRIQRRMQVVGVGQYPDYIDYLEVHPDEYVQLFNTILINVTSYFRDPDSWKYLRDEIVPQLVQMRPGTNSIRIWSTGCASGEEAYSIAMLMAENLGLDAFRERVKIYATDVDEDALNKARQGLYSEKELEGISPDLRQKYFTPANTNFMFDKDLRRNLIFGRNDLIQDAPISRVDLLICRNTLMYFNAETQTRILARFHFALRDTGFLFLGKAEMMLAHTNIFTPLNLRLRVFKRVPRLNLRDRVVVMANSGSDDGLNGLVNLVRVRDSAFNASPQAQFVIDMNNTLVLINERACQVFNLTDNDLGRPFQDLEISYRPVELRSSMQSVLNQHKQVTLSDIELAMRNGDKRYFDVHVVPLFDISNDGDRGVIGISIDFVDVSQHKHMQSQLEQSNHSLETAMEELQSSNEELETTNEELQSTNEELETTNEELQSSNEELETMNEELQSSNEELYTINDELRQRTSELNQVNSYIESILTNLQSGVMVVDRNLRVLVWNKMSEDLWGLRSDEIQGKNLLTLDIGLPLDQLKPHLRACFQGEQERQVAQLEAHNRRGKPVKCKVVITPLLDITKTIQGAIVLIEVLTDNGAEVD